MYPLEALKTFYCKQMSTGWAGGDNGRRGYEIVLGKKIEGKYLVREDRGLGLRLTDQWGEDPATGKPTGSVTIVPIKRPSLLLWAMWFGGESYRPEAIPFLRHVLRKNHEQGEGPRGPKEYHRDQLIYRCHLEGDFAQFTGTEQVCDQERSLGRHLFWGGSFSFLRSPTLKT